MGAEPSAVSSVGRSRPGLLDRACDELWFTVGADVRVNFSDRWPSSCDCRALSALNDGFGETAVGLEP